MRSTSSNERVLLCGLALFLCLSITGFAQSDNGSITGFVKDPSGASVPNATVTARNQSGLQRQAYTNEPGHYIITNIPPGIYSINVEAPGFKSYQSTNNKVDPSSALSVDVTLTLGMTSELVTVTASTATLQTES